jgi:hypothetical protein
MENVKKKHVSGEIIFTCNQKGWVLEELMGKWLRDFWDRRLVALLKKREMLVLDALVGSLTCDLNIHLVVIPGGMISQLRALDMEGI